MHASHAFVTYRDGRGDVLRNLYSRRLVEVLVGAGNGCKFWARLASRRLVEVPVAHVGRIGSIVEVAVGRSCTGWRR